MPLSIYLKPSSLAIVPGRKPRDIVDTCKVGIEKYARETAIDTWSLNFKAQKNAFIISRQSRKKIMESINAMYVLSPRRDIPMKSGKVLGNFQLAFITLTLPSAQIHDDKTIKKEVLNQFLIEIRKHYNVENYLWKAEIQRNENIHFHLVTDQYIDYKALRRRWNRCCEKLGYVSRYRAKFANMTLSKYHALRSKSSEADFKSSAAAYAAGQMCNWSNPNSVDVRSVQSKRDLASYLAKYMAKSSDGSDDDGTDLERGLEFGRSWSRSQSLSRLKYRNTFAWHEIKDLVRWFRKQGGKFHEVTGKFYSVIYFNITQLPHNLRKWMLNYHRMNAQLYDYPIPKIPQWTENTQYTPDACAG